jgi:uncharacterized protein (DUF433 family)
VPRLKQKTAAALWTSLMEDWVVHDEFLSIDLKPFLRSTSERWTRFLAAQDLVSSSPDTLGGTPVIKGTRIPVYDVAASVAAGHSTDRILAAYSSRLTAEQVELAALYAKANPPQGRPRSTLMLNGATPVSEERLTRRRKAE